MSKRFSVWKSEIAGKHPDATISEVRQFGGLVGGFAWVGTQHVGSWPDYLIPGYQILEPSKDETA